MQGSGDAGRLCGGNNAHGAILLPLSMRALALFVQKTQSKERLWFTHPPGPKQTASVILLRAVMRASASGWWRCGLSMMMDRSATEPACVSA